MRTLLGPPRRNRTFLAIRLRGYSPPSIHKVKQVMKLAKRSGKTNVGFTTTYPTWRIAAARQGRYKNIAPDTYLWIAEDPSKHFRAESFNAKIKKRK